MFSISIIWFFFMTVFFYLGYAHFRNSRSSLRSFRIRKPKIQEGDEGSANAAAVIEDFITDFNKYLEILSGNIRTQNLIAAGAYFLAGIAALVSWILGFIPK
jgi:hypothetical protein